jgi:hypothetical protein
MKRVTIITVLILSASLLIGQSLQDSKDFIYEKIGASPPLSNYSNRIFFSSNILRSDAENLAGRKLNEDEFKHLFIYIRDVYMDESMKGWAWSVAECVDIRGITKISATRVTSEFIYNKITVYMDNRYLSNRWSKSVASNQSKNEEMTKMEILISDDTNLANNIKRAIIKMGSYYGVSIKDGDSF